MAGAPRIVCPICGAPLPGAVDVCPACGAALPERAFRVYLKALGVDLETTRGAPRFEERTAESDATVSCQMCGAQFPAAADMCPICGTETAVPRTRREPTTILCVFCGATAVEGQDECEACGAPLRTQREIPSASREPPTQRRPSLEDDLEQNLDHFIAKFPEEDAIAAQAPTEPTRTIRPAARVSVVADRPTKGPRPWGVDSIRTLTFLATIGSLLPAAYVSQSPSEVGRWAVVALIGSLLATALALAFFEAQYFRIGRVPFVAILAGGTLLLSVPLRSALESSPSPFVDGACLAAGLGFIGWASYPIRSPPATYIPWLAALPGAFVQTVVAAAPAVGSPSAASMATWVAIGLAMGLTGVLELRQRWGDRHVGIAMQRAREGATEQGLRGSLAVLDRASQLSHRPDIAWAAKGAALVLLGKYEQAIESIDAALRVNPKNEVAWVNKGNALARMGRHVDALQCYNSSIRSNPGYEVAWNNKGNALARMGRPTDALACYDRALEIDPEYRSAWWNRGYVYATLGDNENAVRCADEVRRLDRRIPAAAP